MHIRPITVLSVGSILLFGGLLFFVRPYVWGQVDTNEGGGEEYQEQENQREETPDDLKDRVRSLESYRSLCDRREAEDIKERLRAMEMIEDCRRKIEAVERRVGTLEALLRTRSEKNAKTPKTQKSPIEPARAGGDRVRRSTTESTGR